MRIKVSYACKKQIRELLAKPNHQVWIYILGIPGEGGYGWIEILKNITVLWIGTAMHVIFVKTNWLIRAVRYCDNTKEGAGEKIH